MRSADLDSIALRRESKCKTSALITNRGKGIETPTICMERLIAVADQKPLRVM
jgi:hypothetical protein